MAKKTARSSKGKSPAVTGNKKPAVADFGNYEGEGFEGQTGDDIAIPFIAVIQSNSPQIDKQDPKYMKDAEVGMLLNTVTDELMESIMFVPAFTKHHYVEWGPRDSGGGFAGTHEIYSDIVKQAKVTAGTMVGKLPMPNSENHLVETFQLYGIIVNADGSFDPAVMSFSSTKIKVYKKANTKWRKMQITIGERRVTPPLFSHLTVISTKGERNAKGSWYNPVLAPAHGSLLDSLMNHDDPRFVAAAEIKALIQEGVAEAVYETSDAAAGSGDATEADPF